MPPGATYLDHAGATLYSCKQLKDHLSDLSSNLYSNPHSRSPSSKQTTAIIDGVREVILRFFNTSSEHYNVIFTSGCTTALSLLSQTFPWQPGQDGLNVTCSSEDSGTRGDSVAPDHNHSGKGSWFCYLDDNHTSVVGMREVALSQGSLARCVSREELKMLSNCPGLKQESSSASTYHLFAYPAQSNFSGYKYPLSWSRDMHEQRLAVADIAMEQGCWKVLLDAASYVSTSPLDLSQYSPNFVSISFYKIFGFPTGLGALLVHRDSEQLLSKSYYGGGTVRATDSWSNFHVGKDSLHDR